MPHHESDWERRAEAAERTVAILKRKVLSLYGGGTRSPLHRALELARQRDERNQQRRELMEVRTEELARHNEELEAKVAQRAHAIKVILDNVTCGFLRVDSAGVVQCGSSLSCDELFGAEAPLDGRQFVDLLGVGGTQTAAEFQLGIDQVFEDLMPTDVSLAQMPACFRVGDRVLDVEGRLIRDAMDSPESILYTITEITELEQTRKQSQHREVLLGILRQRVAFEHFATDVRLLVETAQLFIEDQEHVRRVVHTIKGDAASWGLDEVAENAHRIEDHEEIDADDLHSLESSLRDFLADNVELSGIVYDALEPAFAIQAEALHGLRMMAADPTHAGDIEAMVVRLLRRPAQELLGPIDIFAANLARRLEKPIDFEVHGADVEVDAEIVGPVLRSVGHLLRNAMDHGIEPDGERGSKPACGRVTVSVREDESGWIIDVEDDGCGVRTNEVVRRAIAAGAVTAERAAAMTPDEQIALIFVDGISTASASSIVSGRGVGMSAVAETVNRCGGTIQIETDASGTRVTLALPRVAPLPTSQDGQPVRVTARTT